MGLIRLLGPDPLDGLDPFEVETRDPFDVEPRDPLAGQDPFEFEPRDPLIVPSRRLRQHPTTSNIRVRGSQAAARPAQQPPQPPVAYRRWRPQYHMMAPKGWMNDPCGPLHDEAADVYHIAFQWVPTQAEWSGNICWGHAISRDMVSWEVAPQPILSPQMHSPPKGIFSGCMLRQRESFIAFYTSNSGEVHYTKPYNRGVEALSAATSSDHGRTWKVHGKDPLLSGPPEALTVTGWRDPFVADWPTMDSKRQSSSRNLYGVISGGIKDQGGCLFLYTLDADNPFEWHFVSQLGPMKLKCPLSKWSADFGLNWEVGNFFSLSDGSGAARDCIVVGVEGARTVNADITTPSKRIRSHWMFEQIDVRGSGSGQVIELSHGATGMVDYGCLYSVNTFWNARHQARVAWGWVKEEDLTPELTKEQGWAGSLCMPRELFLSTLHNVTGALKSKLDEITSVEVTNEGTSSGTFTLQTLGQRPARDLESLRIPEGAFDLCHEGSVTLEPLLTSSLSSRASAPVQTESFSIKVSLELGADCSEIGLAIFQGDLARPSQTIICFSPLEEKLSIQRPKSAVDDDIATFPEIAPHTLFYTSEGGAAEGKLEKLSLEIFVDVSVIEVIANERTALTTRIYPASTKVRGAVFYANDGPNKGEAKSKLTDCLAWDGLAASSMILDRQYSSIYT